jgi:hypothetical protein
VTRHLRVCGSTLGQICETVDQVLELVRREWRPQENRPNVNDWNDEFLVAAFARAFRCLRSVREIACRGEADDAAVLTRALIALTLRYLWVGRAPGEQRRERLERLRRKAAEDRATLGEELELVGHLPAGTSAEMRAVADELKDAGVKGMLDDRSIAKQLDRELHPEAPHWFETLYARVYRWTSEPAHYGLAALLQGFEIAPIPGPGVLAIDRRDDERAAEMLGLALISFATLADFGDSVVRHGVTQQIAELVQQHHQRLVTAQEE